MHHLQFFSTYIEIPRSKQAIYLNVYETAYEMPWNCERSGEWGVSVRLFRIHPGIFGTREETYNGIVVGRVSQ